MTADPHEPLQLAVIGGGFTGAIAVMNAIRATRGPLAITVVEPAAELGRGTAYGTGDVAHRINVPTDRMSLFKDAPFQATTWLREQGCLDDRASHAGDGRFYVPRAAYGAFVNDALQQAVEQAGSRVRLTHRRTLATDLARAGEGWTVATRDGPPLEADVVFLCFGHGRPTLPCPMGSDVRQDPKFVGDPWAERALAAIAPTDDVLIVGTGLTMADVVASLVQQGHLGSMTAISRRGLLPKAHGSFRSDYDLFRGEPPPQTALGLLRLLRRRVRQDGDAQGWQSIVDALRFKLPIAWDALPAAQKRKALRLLPIWEVHRFRIAPQIDAVLRRAQDAGQLTVERAGLSSLSRGDGSLLTRLVRADGTAQDRRFDAVVLCTGPEKDLRRSGLPAKLLSSGLARLDDTAHGLAVDALSRVLDRSGRSWPDLFAFGPMTRGTFGEMTGASDIAAHIERVLPKVLSTTPAASQAA